MKVKDVIKVPSLKPRDPNQAVLASKRNAGGPMRDKKQELKRGNTKHKYKVEEDLDLYEEAAFAPAELHGLQIFDPFADDPEERPSSSSGRGPRRTPTCYVGVRALDKQDKRAKAILAKLLTKLDPHPMHLHWATREDGPEFEYEHVQMLVTGTPEQAIVRAQRIVNTVASKVPKAPRKPLKVGSYFMLHGVPCVVVKAPFEEDDVEYVEYRRVGFKYTDEIQTAGLKEIPQPAPDQSLFNGDKPAARFVIDIIMTQYDRRRLKNVLWHVIRQDPETHMVLGVDTRTRELHCFMVYAIKTREKGIPLHTLHADPSTLIQKQAPEPKETIEYDIEDTSNRTQILNHLRDKYGSDNFINHIELVTRDDDL